MAGRCACQRPCNCCTTSTPSISVGGSGGGGQCFRLEARYSPDPGNRARPGSEGGIYADTCVKGPDGEELARDANGCVTLPAPCILNVGGDPIVPDAEGCVQLPASAPPEYDCGLQEDEDGVLSVKGSATWPPPSGDTAPLEGTSADGSGIYCDPISGAIRGAPEHTSRYDFGQDQIVEPGLEVVNGTYTSPSSAAVTMTNPSPSRRMSVQRTLRLRAELVTPAGSSPTVSLQASVNGGAWANVQSAKWPEPSAGSIRAAQQIGATLNSVLNPGDTITVELRAVVQTTDNATLVEATTACTLLGVTR